MSLLAFMVQSLQWGSLLASEADLAITSFGPRSFLGSWIGSSEIQLLLAALLAGTGLWKLVPGGTTGRFRRIFNGCFVVAGLAWMVRTASPDQLTSSSALIWLMSLLAVGSAVLMVTESRPFYSAIWFALVLAGVGGLFLLYDAQFLGVATVAVYAGAIVVTFLFVLMLAHPFGHAFFDRLSWGSLPRWLCCMAGMGMTATLIWVSAESVTAQGGSSSPLVVDGQQVAAFGAQLFSKQLIGVELAGILLTAALVSAIAMAVQKTPGKSITHQLQRAISARDEAQGRSFNE